MTRVRVAGTTDRAALAALRRSWTEEQAGGPVDDPDFEDVFTAWAEREAEHRVTWLVEHDRPVGMLNMLVFDRMPRPGDATAGRARQWGYIANVYVEAAHRDAGLGARLLDVASSYAEERGFARLVLSPSERSIPFYERAGFQPATSLMVKPLG